MLARTAAGGRFRIRADCESQWVFQIIISQLIVMRPVVSSFFFFTKTMISVWQQLVGSEYMFIDSFVEFKKLCNWRFL